MCMVQIASAPQTFLRLFNMGLYRLLFINKNAHSKVQTTITDYIRDGTSAWYAEVGRVATLILE